MKKTAGQIETDIFKLLNNSPLKTMISGRIYKQDTRPFNANTEDIVISFLAGRDAQIQKGVVVVNAYVPDIDNGSGNLVKNVIRCNELESKLNELVQNNSLSNEYKFELDEMIKTLSEDGIKQHFVHCRIKFNRITF